MKALISFVVSLHSPYLSLVSHNLLCRLLVYWCDDKVARHLNSSENILLWCPEKSIVYYVVGKITHRLNIPS